MRVHIFDPKGDILEVIAEGPSSLRDILPKENGVVVPVLSVDDMERRDEGEDHIIESYFHIHKSGCPNDHSELYEDMITHCLTFWSCDPTVLATYDADYQTKDGFIRITEEAVEAGWQERRYN